MTFYPGKTHLMENTVLNVKNRSLTITAEVEIPEEGANGVILAQGGRFAGWSLYVKDGAAKYVHNFLGLEESYVGGEEKLPTGTINIRYHFDFDGDQPSLEAKGRCTSMKRWSPRGASVRPCPSSSPPTRHSTWASTVLHWSPTIIPKVRTTSSTESLTDCVSTWKRTMSATSSPRIKDTTG